MDVSHSQHDTYPSTKEQTDESVMALARDVATRLDVFHRTGKWTAADRESTQRALEALSDQLMRRSRQVHFMAWAMRSILGERPAWTVPISDLLSIMRGKDKVTVSVTERQFSYSREEHL